MFIAKNSDEQSSNKVQEPANAKTDTKIENEAPEKKLEAKKKEKGEKKPQVPTVEATVDVGRYV
jgi:hypothetical protein